MLKQKGASVEMWIWIVGGILFSAILFLIFYSWIIRGSCTQMQNDVKDSFSKFANTAQIICRQGLWARASLDIDLGTQKCGARAIYSSKTISDVDAKYPIYVVEKRKSEGNYLCISFGEEKFYCEKLNCKVNMTYIGTPYKESDMYKIGIGDDRFQYRLSIQKRDFDLVVIDAQHLP